VLLLRRIQHLQVDMPLTHAHSVTAANQIRFKRTIFSKATLRYTAAVYIITTLVTQRHIMLTLNILTLTLRGRYCYGKSLSLTLILTVIHENLTNK